MAVILAAKAFIRAIDVMHNVSGSDNEPLQAEMSAIMILKKNLQSTLKKIS